MSKLKSGSNSATRHVSSSTVTQEYATSNIGGILSEDETKPFQHSWRIWCIFIVLCLLSFMSGLDATIITTSLPTISHDIGGETKYTWIANSYLFASTAIQPLYGQLSNIFGRRNPILLAVSLFAVGSGIGGGARSADMLIAGRVVQGLGTAGLYVLSDVIICDMVPPRNRGPYLSAVISSAGIATTVGPIVGGALVRLDWRWIFWMNLPISAISFLAILFYLDIEYTRSPT